MFCPKCSSMLLPKKEGEKNVLVCSCGYRAGSSQTASATLREKTQKRKEIEVIDKEAVEVLPRTEIVCPKCKHMEAYWWEQQIRSADEPATRFFKCIKCQHTWRDLKSG